MADTSANFGGNVVRSTPATQPGRHPFAEGVFTYYLVVTAGPEEIDSGDLQAATVFVLSKPAAVRVVVAATGQTLDRGDAVQAERAPLTVAVDGAGVRLLVAGTRSSSGLPEGITVTPAASVYRVSKPWGHELWINGQHPTYALKEIAIRKGTQTSLQYHRIKQETNVLFEGTARLHYNKDATVPNEQAGAEHIGTIDVEAVSSIDVVPPVLHRLEAMTDVLLYEVSTPHLDDVIRVQDDAKRPDGRIPTEHKG